MLEKIDQIVLRLNVTYEEAKDALEKNDEDVIKAIIYLEKKSKKGMKELNEKGTEMLDKLKSVLKKGNVTRVIIERDGETMLNIPVTIGAIGFVLGSVASIVGLSAAVLTKCKIKIIRDDGSCIDLNEEAEEKITEIKEKVSTMMHKEDKDITDEVIKESKQEDSKDKDLDK